MRNPAHFEIISSGRYFDHDARRAVARQCRADRHDRAHAGGGLRRQGQLRQADLKQVQIAGRALVYGFARMNIDGHFPRWGVADAEVERTAEAILDLFIEGIAKPSRGLNRERRPLRTRPTRSERTVPPARRSETFIARIMTVQLQFYDTSQAPAAASVSWSSPAKASRQRRVRLRQTPWRPRQIQAPPSATVAAGEPRLASASGGCLAVAAPHLAALAVMLQTETDFGSRARLSAVLGHPELLLDRAAAASGAVGRAVADLVVVLVLLSRLKHDIVQMTANFVDLMVIDRDTAAFLFTIFPNLRWSVIGAGARHRSPDVRAVVARSVPDPPAAGAGLQARLSRRAGGIFLDLAGRGLARLLRRRLSVEIRPLRRHRGVGFHQLRLHGIGRGRDRAPQGAAAGFLPSRRPAAEHHHDP